MRDYSEVVSVALFPVEPPGGGFVPGISPVASSPPGAHQPHRVRVDGRDSTLRSQPGSTFSQTQTMHPGKLILLLFVWALSQLMCNLIWVLGLRLFLFTPF